jgi:ADP-heptose:LPS heptosyltransferase
MTALNPEKIHKILLIKLKGIGDVVLSTIVFDNLRSAFPNAQIDYLTELPSEPLLAALPFLHKTLLFRKKEPLGSLKLIRDVIFGRYDLVIDMFSNPRTALVTFLSGARYRAGFPYRGRAYAYNLPGPVERGGMHAALLHLELLKYIGIPADKKALHFGLTDQDITFSRDFFSRSFLPREKVLAISPSGGWPSKKCEPERFVAFARRIRQSFKIRFLVVWGPGDKTDAELIANQLGSDAVLAPPSSIREMGALMQLCFAVLANDSGPMHIAAALKIPVLSIHGPTVPAVQAAFGEQHESVRLETLDCIGCNLLECPRHHECFRDLSEEMVFEKFVLLIKKNNIHILPNDEKN